MEHRSVTSRHPSQGHRRRSTLPLVGLLCSLASPALAHTQPRPIEQWGPFLPETVTCLQMMDRATHTCFDTVYDIAQACRDAQVRGEDCDTAHVNAVTNAATLQMRRTLVAACGPDELVELGYLGYFDTEADLFNACVTQSGAAVTATYAPAGDMPTPAALDCMTATATYARKVMRFALDHRVPVMERIAARSLTLDERMTSVQRMRTMLGTARTRWGDGLLDVCPSFFTVYGRTPDSYLRTIQQRTDCVLSQIFVNTAVSCTAQVCGNGIPETGEECDDGNNDNTDRCANNCTTNR